LEITGNGTQQFVINGNIRDYYEPRNVIKSGTSSVTLAGTNTFGGSLLITNGEVKLSSAFAAIQGADTIFLGNAGKLTLENGSIDVSQIIDPGGSSLIFAGGRLRVRELSGDLKNDGGTLDLGAAGELSSISGNYSQDSGVLEIELGGASSGTDPSRLFVRRNASLGGALDVRLADGFEPKLGQAFEFLTAEGGVDGSFTALSLPTLGNRFSWRTVYTTTGVSLAVSFQGDYNLDGFVDAADYTVWRDLLGLPVALGSGADGDFDGRVTEADYALWRTNFGAPAAPQVAPIPGDYNGDGVIDAADYTVWRDALEGGGSLLNDPTPGTVDESDFLYWRDHFGETLGSGSGATGSASAAAAVPEPATIGLALVGLLPLVGRRTKRLGDR
jgi:autotransporter-associated beta strand protein